MFKVPEGLEITVWATSPQLFNPANMDIDHAGRVWVTEGVNYRRHSGRSREGDCVRVLQDTDGDGKCDSSHVFVREKELECPLGVAVFDERIDGPMLAGCAIIVGAGLAIAWDGRRRRV